MIWSINHRRNHGYEEDRFKVRYNWNLSSDGSFSKFREIRRPYFGLFFGSFMNYGYFIEITKSRMYCRYYEMWPAYTLRNTTHRVDKGKLQSFANKSYRKFHDLGVL